MPKLSIYLSDAALALLPEGVENISGAISDALHALHAYRALADIADLEPALTRYHALLAPHQAFLRQTLSRQEQLAIADAMNGWASRHTPTVLLLSTVLDGDRQLNLLAATVLDAIRLEGLAEKWQIDGQALVDKIGALAPLQVLALIDAAERWESREDARADLL